MGELSNDDTRLDAALDELCQQLAARASELEKSGHWPAEQLRLCGEAGVFRWFVPRAYGGVEWSDEQITHGYLRLSASCLTTAFIITQRTAACQRIIASQNEQAKQRLLAELAVGDTFATVGISHLSTSRRHLGAILCAEETSDGFVLDGYTPWVTGAAHAEVIVIGAELADGRQILTALPMNLPGIEVSPPAQLVGLSASHTGEVRLSGVAVSREWLLAGPAENVMQTATRGGTGGLQTSTLAVGLSAAAIDLLESESQQRPGLAPPAAELRAEHQQLRARLLGLARGEANCTNDEIRAAANSLALRSTQAALAAAKGAGYVVGHPAGRWCREALFFLVWSCPQGVMNANLCELAGLE